MKLFYALLKWLVSPHRKGMTVQDAVLTSAWSRLKERGDYWLEHESGYYRIMCGNEPVTMWRYAPTVDEAFGPIEAFAEYELARLEKEE